MNLRGKISSLMGRKGGGNPSTGLEKGGAEGSRTRKVEGEEGEILFSGCHAEC